MYLCNHIILQFICNYRKMKRIIFLVVCAFMLTANALAQIPAQVNEVMAKCKDAMTNPNGVEYYMDVKASVGPVGMFTTHYITGSRGEKTKATMSMAVMGKEITFMSGFDGNESWELTSVNGHDTIRIEKGMATNKKNKDDGTIDFDLAEGFKKASMKEKDGYYVIDYSDPVDKKSEIKKMTVKVSTKNYCMHEMKTSAKGVRITMTVTKIKIGLTDDYFKLDLSKYPKAVVIRK